ncbi:type II toxin-antitoxin system RelE/ParE family toxin [Allosaccharopolyspora coralli]|uniref:Type II toxin-antitoxin system RelE/ParE family toxin n=1 Tax=Allosaccharopolyspora coralli TaxID=2665642 RepID=A0A5Q3Q2M4_9PSEU|nr:type II toxin-antitoxin system RelE/ParE family toxin [Allosaccharopolyspora coralli]QGK68838.1 type II toxin-antitoxin system RelE/ParE family toxin [Allosaccharopolyspora coralli]
MSHYRLEITRDAVKTLAKLDKPIRRRLQAAIEKLRDDPRPGGVVAVTGQPGYLRRRVGDYRILYRVDDNQLVVVVVALGHRREVYER